MLSFGEIGGERGDLVFAQLSFAMSRSGFLLDGCMRRFDCFCGLSGRRFGFRASIGKQPAGEPAGESAGNAAAARSRGGQIANCARCWLFHRRLLFMSFMFDNGSRSERCCRLPTVFCERFTGENDFVLGSNGSGRRRRARRIGTTIVVAARLAAAIFVTAGFAALRRSIF